VLNNSVKRILGNRAPIEVQGGSVTLPVYYAGEPVRFITEPNTRLPAYMKDKWTPGCYIAQEPGGKCIKVAYSVGDNKHKIAKCHPCRVKRFPICDKFGVDIPELDMSGVSPSSEIRNISEVPVSHIPYLGAQGTGTVLNLCSRLYFLTSNSRIAEWCHTS